MDVYRRKYPAEENFFKLALFLSFFPHIIQGPFSRFDDLGKTLFIQHDFSYVRLCEGCRRILWGYFKKLLIADNIGVVVNEIFSNYGDYSGPHMLLVAFFYSIQIYADFSGYMDIVCGISHILGIGLAENFNQPYFSRSIDEFWRRWHITLGQWFRDYLFYPVAMSKKTQKIARKGREKLGQSVGRLIPSYFALFFVWTATGLWHGATWTYLIWGYFNFFIISISLQLTPLYDKVKACLRIKEGRIWQLFQIIRTFFLVCLFRLFSRGESVSASIEMLGKMFNLRDWTETNWYSHLGTFFPDMSFNSVMIFVVGVLCLIIVDIFNECGKWELVKERCPYIIRCFVYIFLLFAIILFAGENSDLVGGFIYENF